MPIISPHNPVDLNSITVVKLNKNGKRFELATHRNLVEEYRQKKIKHWMSVVQSNNVYLNLKKGQLANNNDLKKAFNSEDKSLIIKEIIEKGEVQTSTKEKEEQVESLKNEIIEVIRNKCYNPLSDKPYKGSTIKIVMEHLNFNVRLDASSKSQALELMKLIEETKALPIYFEPLNIKIHCNINDAKKIKKLIKIHISSIIQENTIENDFEVNCLIDAGKFELISDLIKSNTKGEGIVYKTQLETQK